jgi:ABC-type polysaccharide/polyol phosphate export permease
MAGQAQVRTFSAGERPDPLELIVSGVRDIWSRRRLTRYLVEADLHKHGADTILGNVWWFLDPLLQMIVYVILVAVIFQAATPDYPLFIFAAILPWKWFSSSINDAITSVTARERIIKQVNFPKIVLPVASTSSGIVGFAFGLVPMFGLMLLFYADRISPFLLLIPVVAAVQFVFTLACAVFVSAANVFFRDIGNVARHLLRVWFYLSPALYSLDTLSNNPTLQSLMMLNPFTAIFESYRNVIYAGTWPLWGPLAVLLAVSVVLFGLATIFFKRVEPAFAKVL